MAKQIINIGTTANDGTGDTLRESQRKANDNFTELYDADSIFETRISALEANPTGKPPVDAEPYADVAALLAAQNTQEEDYFYEVTDASGFTDPDITTGNAVVLLTKTPGVDATGTEADYIVVWAKEFELGGNGGATLTSQLTNDGDDTINPFIDRTDVFTNTDGGTVPPPNVSDTTTYGGAITFPTEGFTVTEGDTVSVTATESAVVVGASRKKLVNESPFWVDDSIQRELKIINASPYTVVESDKDKHLYSSSTAIPGGADITIPIGTFSEDVELVFSNGPFKFIESGGNFSFVAPVGRAKESIGIGTVRMKLIYNEGTATLTGDLVKTYEIYQSPNGTLYKVGVDNAGARTSTLL